MAVSRSEASSKSRDGSLNTAMSAHTADGQAAAAVVQAHGMSAPSGGSNTVECDGQGNKRTRTVLTVGNSAIEQASKAFRNVVNEPVLETASESESLDGTGHPAQAASAVPVPVPVRAISIPGSKDRSRPPSRNSLGRAPSAPRDTPSPALPMRTGGSTVSSIHQSASITPANNKKTPKRPVRSASGAEREGHLFKVLVVGNTAVGKTSVIKRYAHDTFSEQFLSTIGVDFALKILNMNDDTIIRLQLWDIAGQEQFGTMTRVYYKGAVGAFVVINIGENEGMSSITGWKADLDDKVTLPNGDPIPVVLLANKCDLDWDWTPQALDRICEREKFLAWFNVSAKMGTNIHEANACLVRQMMKNLRAPTQDVISLQTHQSIDQDATLSSDDKVNVQVAKEPSLDDHCCA